MGEEMPYIPYGQEGEWKKRFEMTIPILLLILVFLVIAWKMEWLVGLPVIGDLFGDSSIDIAIIGNDQTLVKTIETDIRKSLPVNTFVLTKADLNGIRDTAKFAKYDMIILTEGQDGDTIDLEVYTLEYLRSFVESGKPAIVIGLAASEVTNSPQESGWSKLGFVPAVCKQYPCDQTRSSYDRMTMYVRDINHPVLAQFVEPLLFQDGGQIYYTMVNPSGGSSILDMEIMTGEDTYTGTAIVDSGKVLYFAFHPSTYSPLLYNSIKHLG